MGAARDGEEVSINTIATRERSDGFTISTVEVSQGRGDKRITYDVTCLGRGCEWSSFNTPDPDGDATRHLNECEATGFER